MKRVLIVDDSQEDRTFLSDVLSQAGFTVEAPARPEMAPALARQRRPDAILLEISLPGGLDGFDLLRLFGRDPGLKGVPVLMITVKSEREDVTRALQLGARDYVIKPIDAVTIVARVENALGLNKTGDEESPDDSPDEVKVARQPTKAPPGTSEPPAPSNEQAN